MRLAGILDAGGTLIRFPLDGGCLCGAVRYRISAAPRSADYCHCRMCRRAAGAPLVARLTVANSTFAWTRGEPAVFRSSPAAERLFCRVCGTQLALRDEPDYLDVTIASLDEPAAVRPRYHSGPRAGSPGATPRTTCRATRSAVRALRADLRRHGAAGAGITARPA